MTTSPVPWLPPPDDALPGADDPWAESEIPTVELTADQRGFLASFGEQPAVPRLRGVGDPIEPFEEPGGR